MRSFLNGRVEAHWPRQPDRVVIRVSFRRIPREEIFLIARKEQHWHRCANGSELTSPRLGAPSKSTGSSRVTVMLSCGVSFEQTIHCPNNDPTWPDFGLRSKCSLFEGKLNPESFRAVTAGLYRDPPLPSLLSLSLSAL